MYTYQGDVNLDGQVTAADYQIAQGNVGIGSPTWVDGDVNYDGGVDSTDLGLIAGEQNITPQVPDLGPVTQGQPYSFTLPGNQLTANTTATSSSLRSNRFV